MSTLPARTGIALHLPTSHTLKITNPHGAQVVDFWALNISPSPSSPPSSSSSSSEERGAEEYLSMSHNHSIHRTLRLRAGSTLYSSLSRPMLSWLEDSSLGDHDTLIAACNPLRYERLGVGVGHASCAGNYQGALRGLGLLTTSTTANSDDEEEGKGNVKAKFPITPPTPLNLFMNVQVVDDDDDGEGGRGKIVFRKPTSKAGDFVVFKALMDVVVVMSACPMDQRASEDWVPDPKEVLYEVLEG